jgi:Cohesin domain
VNKKEKGENIMKANAKILSILMIASIMLGFAAILPVKAAGGVIYVDPANNIFSSPPVSAGDTFTVSVTVANITGLAGLSFDFAWDPTLLKVNSMTEVLFHTVTPSAFYGNIWNLKLAFNNTGGTAQYAQTWQDTAQAQLDGYAPANITTPIVACSFVFQVLVNPPFHGNVNCALTISNVKAGDLGANPIPVTSTNGYYELDWAPLTSKPYFTVIPSTYTASAVGEIFNITVCVNNLASGWAAVGFEFKLSYNASILQLLGVSEGSWLPPFGVSPNQGTLFLTAFGAGFVQIGDVVLPDINGTWHPPFPSAANPNNVPMAILTFNATAQGLFPTVLSCPLHLYDTKVGDYLGNPVVQDPPVDGFYSIKPKVLGRAIDIFVGQDGSPYPNPYGGQGPNAPADMFWPQKQVCVWAYVTYNEWPEQQKDVAFEIFDPHGTRWGLIYARTNETGYAYTCFRLPWPCDNPEYYIGVWTIIGSVDVACNIVNDTVQFHYDYLVRIWKVTADKATYKHNETACYTIEYGSHAQQTYNVTIAVTGLDETGVPFGFAYKQVQIGGTVFCTYKNFTDTLCIYIPKWARAGQGEVDTAFLDNWPSMGGTVQSGYYTGSQWLGYCPIPINIEAAWA